MFVSTILIKVVDYIFVRRARAAAYYLFFCFILLCSFSLDDERFAFAQANADSQVHVDSQIRSGYQSQIETRAKTRDEETQEAKTREEILGEERQDNKWPTPAVSTPEQSTPKLSHEPLSISRELFHFFLLEKETPQGRAAESSTNHSKTKEIDELQPQERSGDINALVVSRDGRHAYAGMNRGELLALELIRDNPDENAGKAKAKGGKPNKLERGGIRISRQVLLTGEQPILGLAMSKNERYLAITRFGLVQIFDRFKKQVLFELSKLETRLVAVDWDPRSELVVIGGVGGDIYTWNVFEGPAAGRDSMDAVESYEGHAPVVDLLFHPSARGFFAAQQDGEIVFWRLLRTERELGLRDEGAKIDIEKRGRVSSPVTTLGTRPEQIWLEEGGERLFASSADGKVYRWRVRGLEKETEIFIGTDQSSNVVQVPFVVSGKGLGTPDSEVRPLISSGRGQRVAIFCAKAPDEKLTFAPVSVVPSNPNPVAPSPAAILVDGRIEENAVPAPTPTPVINSSVPIAPFAESERFDSPIGTFASGSDSAVLWAIQKGGTLVVFDATQLKRAEGFERELNRCLSQAGK